MAKPPMKKPAKKTSAKKTPPMADDDDETSMDAQDGSQGSDNEEGEPSDDDEGSGSEDQDESGQVIATILKNDDGTFTLIAGDENSGGEPDSSESSDNSSESDEGDEDEGDEEGADDDKSEPERQVFQTEGELLKGVLDIIRKEGSEDEGAADQEFSGGFNEEKEPSPAAGTPGRANMY